MKIVEQSVELIDHMGSDLSVVNAARVSFHKESDWDLDPEDGEWGPHTRKFLNEKDQKLIAYLSKHNHWSPFAHAFLSFRIKAPIFVARQLVKHQVGLAWNEVSRRYVDEEPEFWFPEVWRGKPVNAKQGSSDSIVTNLLVPSGSGWESIKAATEEITRDALLLYQDMIEAGVAPEQARMVLPQNTMTEWIWSGSLAAFARVCKLRLDPHAQQETREVAQMINDQVPKEFEHSWKALML
jgi:thymidylate synthase (FAD)